jgi:radical SAM protein with 4Fe4S-binding SPASM domain
MRSYERTRGLLRTPKLLLDVLVRGRYDFIYDRMPMTATGMDARKRFNLFTAGTHLLRRSVKPLNMPLHLEVEFTNFCNLKCPVCPTGIKQQEREPVAMRADLFEQVWEETAPYLLTASLFGWGEPLLHPQIGRMLEIAGRHDVVTLLSTNGMPLRTESVREALVEFPPSTLIVAIDGLTDETNSRYRVGAQLEPILDGVAKLAELRKKKATRYPVLQMRFLVMKHNEHELQRLEPFARQHGFELLTLRSLGIFDIQNADNVQRNFVPENELLRAYSYEKGNRRRRDDFICTMPFWFPGVFAGGEVVSCDQDHSATHAFGKLDGTNSFRDIWFSNRAAEVRRTIRDECDSVGFCRNCPYADRPTTDCSLESRMLVPDAEYPGLFAGKSS